MQIQQRGMNMLHRSSETPLLCFYTFFLSSFFSPSHPAGCIVFFYLSRSPPFHFDYYLLHHFSSPPPSPSFLPIFLSGAHHLSSVVSLRQPTPFSPSHSFPLPQSNSRSFIGIIRWILLSLCVSFWNICLPITNPPLLMLLHKTPSNPVRACTRCGNSTARLGYRTTIIMKVKGIISLFPVSWSKQVETECHSCYCRGGLERNSHLIKLDKSCHIVWSGLDTTFMHTVTPCGENSLQQI